MVAIYKDYLGRGPTKAYTKVHEDMVITVLQDSLTKAEQKLQDSGRGETVRGLRRTFQEAMRDEIVALVEKATERKVACMLSDHNPSPDYAVEVLVLDRASA
jgi:uncharacterized protein YbcI